MTRWSLLGALIGVLGWSAAAQQAPRSAIPWLSKVLADPVAAPAEPQATNPNAVITVTSLDDRNTDGVGILTSEQSGLPSDIWTKSNAGLVDNLLKTTPYGGPPALKALHQRLLLTTSRWRKTACR